MVMRQAGHDRHGLRTPARHTDLGITSTYLQGIDPSEIINAVRSRRPPMISMTASLDL